MPVLFPITELLFRVPRLGRWFQFAIPVANYVHERQLSMAQRYRWAILDTFDMLAGNDTVGVRADFDARPRVGPQVVHPRRVDVRTPV